MPPPRHTVMGDGRATLPPPWVHWDDVNTDISPSGDWPADYAAGFRCNQDERDASTCSKPRYFPSIG